MIAQAREFDFCHFEGERTAAENCFSLCCAHGQGEVPHIQQPPTLLDDLLTA